MYTFGQAVAAFFANYFRFSGRAQRSEYWWAYLFVLMVNLPIMILAGVDPVVGGTLNVIATLVFFVPQISLTVRRLHDTDRTGWWYAAAVAPWIVAAVVMAGGTETAMIVAGVFCLLGLGLTVFVLVCMFLSGTPGANRFGEPSAPPVPVVRLAPAHA
jgi:uncharacterized membrane protein YhaH (DUF805 family)